MAAEESRPWHHRPAHVFLPSATYMVTAGTLHKEQYFRHPARLHFLHDQLLALADRYGWQLQAWAVFPNHYHWIACSPTDATNLRKFVGHLHTATAAEINRQDAMPGRKVWFQYWDTCLTYEASYHARVNYVHHNAVHHKLVAVADQYDYCSARWFKASADAAYRRKIESYRTEHLNVPDDF